MRRAAWLVPLLAGALAYAMAPWGDLVWDDKLLHQQMLAITGLTDVLQPPAGIAQWSYQYYRPVTVLSYRLDLALFGPKASAGPHLLNVLYHLASTGFTFMLARQLVARHASGALAATVAATLFAVHPIHTESVNWITGRSDVLATALLLPALLAGLRFRTRGGYAALALSTLLFMAALLAKEVAIAGLALLPLLGAVPVGHEPAAAGGRRGRLLVTAACWLGAAVCYFTLRAGAGAGLGAAGAFSLAEALPGVLRAAGWYVAKLVVPWPQSNFVAWDMLPGLGVAAAVLAALGALLAGTAWRWRARGEGVAFVGLAWACVALAPSLAATLPGLAETPVAERYLYLPSVGACLAAGALYATLSAGRWALAAGWGTAALVMACLAGTVQRGLIWMSDLTLWSDTTAKAPGYGLPRIELGRAREAQGDLPGAMADFEAARTLSNTPETEAIAHYNVGMMLARRGQIAAAERSFVVAIATDPTYPRGHYGLARMLIERASGPGAARRAPAERLADLTRAADALDTALGLNPTFVDAAVAYAWADATRADLLRAMGNGAEARALEIAALDRLDAAVRIDPSAGARPEVAQLREALLRALSAR
jgi:hypothetical protein